MVNKALHKTGIYLFFILLFLASDAYSDTLDIDYYLIEAKQCIHNGSNKEMRYLLGLLVSGDYVDHLYLGSTLTIDFLVFFGEKYGLSIYFDLCKRPSCNRVSFYEIQD
jgi:hypothetical protein